MIVTVTMIVIVIEIVTQIYLRLHLLFFGDQHRPFPKPVERRGIVQNS